MAWQKVDETPSVTTAPRIYRAPGQRFDGYEHASTTIALDTWKCRGCGRRACGRAGQDPGRCLNPGCPTYSAR